jgi:hypothetical protein
MQRRGEFCGGRVLPLAPQPLGTHGSGRTGAGPVRAAVVLAVFQ